MTFVRNFFITKDVNAWCIVGKNEQNKNTLPQGIKPKNTCAYIIIINTCK